MDIYTAINTRRSVRKYSPRPIPPEVLDRVLNVLRAAPSACNNQPWKFILVQDESLRQKVAAACKNQLWMAAAPVIVAACGFSEMCYKNMGGESSSIDIDIAIALDHLTLAAAAEGLGTCWIGAFSEMDVKSLLRVPDNIKLVALTPLGYPKTPAMQYPLDPSRRKTLGEIICKDYYQ